MYVWSYIVYYIPSPSVKSYTYVGKRTKLKVDRLIIIAARHDFVGSVAFRVLTFHFLADDAEQLLSNHQGESENLTVASAVLFHQPLGARNAA